MSRLLIVDGHAVIHRAYHSIPKLTSNGQVVNAVYGFYSMLLSAIDQLHPKYVIVCSDSPGPNFRNEEYLGYRSKRSVPDQDLVRQFPIIESSLTQSTIPVFSMGGYEADDLIATLARQAVTKKSKKTKKKFVNLVTIITGDKDLMQLVDRHTQLLMPVRGLSEIKIITPKEVKQKLNVHPDQVVDLKALMGDSSDSYPGVQGIGPKGATTLLNKYQNLDNIYRHLDEITPPAKEKLEKGKEDAYLSQKLATLVYNVPIHISLKSAKWDSSKESALLEQFKLFNFKSLINRLQNLNPELKPSKSTPSSDPNQGSLF